LYPAGKASYIDKQQPIIDAQQQILNEQSDLKSASDKLLVGYKYMCIKGYFFILNIHVL
jgi:hypothetical protein